MRGYRLLRDSGALGRVADLNNTLAAHPLAIPRKLFSGQLFGAGLVDAEAVTRQLLLTRVAGLDLNRALLYSLGSGASPLAFQLPPEWRAVIRGKGFNVASLGSALRWNFFVAVMWLVGLLRIGQVILGGIKAACGRGGRQFGRYAYFDGLAPGNLPHPCRDGRSHDIVTWYRQWEGREQNVDRLCHGVAGAGDAEVQGTPLTALAAPLPPLADPGALARFTAWSVVASLLAAADLLRGRWWHALLLPQAALAAQVRLLESELLAREYLFHNSGYIYRPLWTYEAEKQGARITFYFYSTNCEPFKGAEGYQLPYGWGVATWPHYLVWDDYQEAFVRRAVRERGCVSVVGPIWFSTSAEEMPELGGGAVALFDVTPHRASRYRVLGMDPEYYVPGTCIPFLQHVQKAVDEAGCKVLWKRKRKIGSLAHPLYRFYAEQVSECANVVIVDPDISAYRVIEASSAVISMPFTSTALIAREIGKPSCYYDPNGVIRKDDRAAHGIPIITGRAELGNWLKSVSVSG